MWEAVAARGRQVTFAPGDVLLHHGEISRHCYAIRSGDVLVTATSTQGSTVVLARRGPGTVIGEIGALDGSPRSATVNARTEVTAVVLTADEFEELLRDEPELALAEIKRLSRQFRDLTERYSVRSEELRMRLLQLLETHARETGDPVFRSTREELAGWVGATREAVIRALRELEDEGKVALDRGSVALVR
jgi:CRP/FNR family transcriptional regulator, cyclic AMP receptor protein